MKKFFISSLVIAYGLCTPLFVFSATGTIDGSNFTSPFLDNFTHLFSSNPDHSLYWNTTPPFDVTVSDTELKGFVWGDDVGWLSLNCSNLNSCNSQFFKVTNDGNGNLSGYAWGENTGWVSFSCANPETNNCASNNNARVTINPVTGKFSGYAWSENFGWILFDCDSVSTCVQTTWRKSNSGSSGGGIQLSLVQKILALPPKVLPNEPAKACKAFFVQYIQKGSPNNNEDSVKKLEMFLNDYQGETLEINGIYESADIEAVKRFQVKYRSDILDPWGLKNPTGYVYIATLAKINSFSCTSMLSNTAKCPYFTYYHKLGDVGGDVKKIQNFLNATMNTHLDETGLFDKNTLKAIKTFQGVFSSSILSSWGLTTPPGKWGMSTKRKANEIIGCKEPPLYVDFLKKTLR